MKNAEINLITALKTGGHDEIADHVLVILNKRDEQLQTLRDELDTFERRYETLSSALDHFVSLELEHHTQVVTEMKSAFPEEDLRGHHDYHVKLMKSAEAQEKFYTTLTQKIAEKGAIMAILFLLGVLMVGFGVKIKSWLGL